MSTDAIEARLRELLAINRALAETLDYEEVLALVVEKTAELTQADGCALLLAEDGVARVAAQRGLDEERAEGFRAPFDERIQEALRELLAYEAADAFVGAPVIRRGRVAGMLVAFRKQAADTERAGTDRARMDRDDEEILAALADQTAIALDHAGRYRELWQKSQVARRELELAARRKDEFLAMLAHELRNPMAAIVYAIEVLRVLVPDEPKLQQVSQAADRQAMHMKRLLDDLLDVSRVTRGRIGLSLRRVEVREIVDQALHSLEPLIAERRHRLEVDLPADPIVLDCDPDRMVQVVSNLLTNAAKYTDPGGNVRLSVAAAEGEVTIRVADDGLGIPADLLPSIFDLFVQSGRAPHRAEGGLGIGLTLVHRLVEMHGGRVEARSAGLGTGSEFEVRLPQEAAADAAPPAGGRVFSGAAGRSVLLVEDNEDVAETLALALESQGHRVKVVGDGEEALAAAERERPEVALVDIGLPGMDGYEVATRLRRQLAEDPPLIVALTGFGSEEARERSREAGFDHHLVKPVDPDQLNRLLAAPESAAR